jgi:glutathione S-transferase
MKLYWCAKTRSSRVVWMLEELGENYERVVVDVRDPEAKKHPGFRSASLMGKVPALEDGEVRMADSAAICMYLADRYAPGTLAPALDDPDRGMYLYWMTFSPGVIEPAMAEKAGGWTADRGRNGWGSFDLMIRTLECGLEQGPWLFGERFTAADVMVGSSAAFLHLFKMLPPSEVIEAYVARCLARPAYQKAIALDG